MAPSHPIRTTAMRCAALAVAAVLTFAMPASAFAAARVWVDAGHGGTGNVGAVSGGVYERMINLAVSRRLADELARRGVLVGETRTDDSFVANADRPARAGSFGADLFVSVHCNSYTTDVPHGPLVIYQPWERGELHTVSKALAGRIQAGLKTVYGDTNQVNKADNPLPDGFVVLKYANMPAVLVELAFLSNPVDRALLVDPLHQAAAARVMADAIVAQLGEYSVPTTRIWGETLYDTSAEVALAGWPDGSDTVIVASGRTYADALAASSLAGKLDAPILLTEPTLLTAATADALLRLRPANVLVVGGPLAVSPAVAEQALAVAYAAAGLRAPAIESMDVPSSVETTSVSGESTDTPVVSASEEPTVAMSAAGAGPTLRRIGGETLYDTAYLIAREVGVASSGPGAGAVLLATGDHYADAVSASAAAASYAIPLLLTPSGSLGDAARRFLSENDAAVTTVEMVGGTLALKPAVEQSAARYGTVVRSWGETLYDTSVAVAGRFAREGAPRNVLLATGEHYADALVAGPLAARMSSTSLVLVHDPVLTPGCAAWLDGSTCADTFERVYLMGGTAALSTSFERSLGYSIGLPAR